MAVTDKPGKRKLQAGQEQVRQRGPGKPPPRQALHTQHKARSRGSAVSQGYTTAEQRLKRVLPGSGRVTNPWGAGTTRAQATRWLWCGRVCLLPAVGL